MSKLVNDIIKLIDYDPIKGTLTRKSNGKTIIHTGKIARINGHNLGLSQIAWILQYGFKSKDKIFYLNGDFTDLRLSNLMVSRKNTALTQDILKRLYKYSKKTGLFTIVGTLGGERKIGEVAGFLDKQGYLKIHYQGKDYRAHRLAWLYVTGSFPNTGLDHINHIRDDNRWTNLRLADQLSNLKNSSMYKNNRSGYNGIRLTKAKTFEARIGINGKDKHLGSFKTIEEAITARKQAEIKYGFHENHGKPK